MNPKQSYYPNTLYHKATPTPTFRIRLAAHYGLCFGVRDAIAEAERLAADGPLTVLGEIVHNPVVRERLAGLGVREGQIGAPPDPAGSRVMITAHGTSDRVHAGLDGAGFQVADGTCPLVRHAHGQLRFLVGLGYFPVIIGKAGHVEVRGLMGDFPETCVIGDAGDLHAVPERPRYGVISQTTQPLEHVLALVAELGRARPQSEVRFVDTVCQPTKNRQNALRNLIAECDTLVVVGGRNSNNTLQLVAAATVAGRAVFHVERPEELRSEWFRNAREVGVTAGTSTLKETVAAVHTRLRHIASELRDISPEIPRLTPLPG